jgi:hypothetical protein
MRKAVGRVSGLRAVTVAHSVERVVSRFPPRRVCLIARAEIPLAFLARPVFVYEVPLSFGRRRGTGDYMMVSNRVIGIRDLPRLSFFASFFDFE